MTRLVQLKKGTVRRLALVEEPFLRVLDGRNSVYELAQSAIKGRSKVSDLAYKRLTTECLDYDPIYSGHSEWRLLPPIDHPDEPSRCMISGTGLTHLVDPEFSSVSVNVTIDRRGRGAGIRLEDGDIIQVAFDGFGRPLRNSVHVENSGPQLIEVTSLG